MHRLCQTLYFMRLYSDSRSHTSTQIEKCDKSHHTKLLT